MKVLMRGGTSSRGLLMLAVLGLTACSEEGPSGPEVSAIEINIPSGGVMMTVGGSYQATANVTGPGAGVPEWRSLDSTVVTISASGLVTAVGLGDGRVTASVGALADTATITVSRVAPGGSGWLEIFSGEGNGNFTCGRYSDEQIYCWGIGPPLGSLGSDQPGGMTNVPARVDFPPGTRIREMGLGTFAIHCAVADGGTGYCWGRNATGLGNSSTTSSERPVRVELPAGEKFVSIATTHNAACGLVESGKVYCWGSNSYGALGVPAQTLPESAVPVEMPLPAGLTFVRMDGGFRILCGVTATDELWCWGDNSVGSFGAGNIDPSVGPVRASIPALRDLAMRSSTCAVAGAGDLYCWGGGYNGMLATGETPTAQPVPVRINVPGKQFLEVGLGNVHACAVTTDYGLYCWGHNSFGTLGPATVIPNYTDAEAFPLPFALQLPAGLRVDDVAASRNTLCVLTLTGEIWCWGEGTSGELGNGANQNSLTPVRVAAPNP